MLRILIFFSVIAAIWLIKGIITSGCLLYPIAGSCLDVPWSAKLRAASDSKWITAWARHPETKWYSLETFDWLENWWLNNYRKFLENFAATFLGLALLSILLQISLVRKYRFDYLKLAGLLVLFVSLALWFFKAPAPRFGTGVFLIFPAFFAYMLIDENHLKIPLRRLAKYAFKPALFLVIVLSFGWSSKAFKNAKFKTFNTVTVTTPEFVDDTIYGRRPVLSDQCWLVPDCSPYFRQAPKKYKGYIMFSKAKRQP